MCRSFIYCARVWFLFFFIYSVFSPIFACVRALFWFYIVVDAVRNDFFRKTRIPFEIGEFDTYLCVWHNVFITTNTRLALLLLLPNNKQMPNSLYEKRYTHRMRVT